MKRFFLLIALFLVPYITAKPCTTFVLKTKDGIFFGRNLDWVSDMGFAIINKRNMSKESLVFGDEKSISWVSKYGSISFNQFGKEFPFGGMNEKGLVVEIMVSVAEYPEPDNRAMINELQWVQYQLDNCQTVDEVIATDNKIRIGQAHESLHYLVSDANGNVAAIEFTEGKMVVYKGKDLPMPVLENDLYSESLENYKENRLGRFSTAVDGVKKYKESSGKPVEYCFDLLKKVALSGEWSMVYDINKKEIHFRTNSNENIRQVNFTSFDFGCNDEVLGYDLASQDAGNVSSKFIKLSSTANNKLVKDAMAKGKIVLETDQSSKLMGYFNHTKCAN